MKTIQRIVILGGVRIPFARQNTNYADASNTDMLTAALKGVDTVIVALISGCMRHW